MKKKIRIIINPISGTGLQIKAEKAIQTRLDKHLFDSEIVYSQYKGHMTLLAKEAADKAFDAVVVVGGDGSINEVAQALIGTDTALAIIPIGSGNGLARYLKIPTTIDHAIERLNQFNIKKIDTAKVNEQVFVSIAGIGFDAHIAEKFSLSKKRGLWNYTKISILEYFHASNHQYQIVLDGEIMNTEAFMIVFANSNQFGNDVIISPMAQIDDGFLDVCIVQKPRLHQIPRLMIQVWQKKAHHSKLVTIRKAKTIQLVLDKLQPVNLDGEAIQQRSVQNILINPLSLAVVI